MKTTRLEAFSDGVLAIIITIMVLEIKIPHGDTFASLISLGPIFLSYLLSFIYIGIYWNNHHHLFTAAESISGKVLWANLNLLFWISLFPFATGWMGENHFTATPTSFYGIVLLMAAISYSILVHTLILHEGKESLVSKAIGNDFKGNISIVLYALAIPLAYVYTWIAQILYVIVAIIWFIPDKRIENKIK
ncbi:TPA: TMEM175 family protein [Legionella bozemanae]|uniref:TMEM175 family protein n=1 Tax=Legionella bozemanae TaxID=447 RepID=UPI001040E8E3|nr:TMEM175 family protein [Legionella bozemanae]